MKKIFSSLLINLFLITTISFTQTNKKGVWIPDNGNGTYSNPIIYSDFSDPDVIRVDNDFFMTSSSFSHFPGLPILHSKDLINWEIISYAVYDYPYESFKKPQHGNGIWAPSIRYHNKEFYIYFGDPDYGIFMTKTRNPSGKWDKLHLVQQGKGMIDPCPFWDEDGNAYIVHAWAKSRAGFNSVLTLKKMSPDGKQILDEGVTVFDGTQKHPTIEGPKFYKRNGFYYIFAPAGGVRPGWQTVLRSKNIYGPYEDKVVLEQGSTGINGPHQGAWVQTLIGEDWFIHFQDKHAYGRVIHLQPMEWENDWPIMGKDYDNNGVGEPVLKYRKPYIGKGYNEIIIPQTNDEFDSSNLGLQWQWQALYKNEWTSLKDREGWLRFYVQLKDEETKNLWDVPFLLMQKFPAPNFSIVTMLEPNFKSIGEKSGLIIFGYDYSYISIEKTEDGYKISNVVCENANKHSEERIIEEMNYKHNTVYFKVDIKQLIDDNEIPKAICKFSFSEDGKMYKSIGKEFTAKEGRWVGAKVGLFSLSKIKSYGYTDFDWFLFN